MPISSFHLREGFSFSTEALAGALSPFSRDKNTQQESVHKVEVQQSWAEVEENKNDAFRS